MERELRHLTDAELLRCDEPEAFGVFYERHLAWVVGWLITKTRDREIAADLTGEVFARALRARRSFDPKRGGGEAWLQTIARNTLVDSIRRGKADDRARQALGIAALDLTADDLERVDALADEARGDRPALSALDALPEEQAAAIRSHVIDGVGYEAIAGQLRCSQAVVRQRVSRGLRTIKTRLEEAAG